MRRFVTALGSLALVTLASAPALADCIPGTAVCASAGVGVDLGVPAVQAAGQITVTIPPIVLPIPGVAPAPPPPPPAPVVVYTPPPYGPAYGPPSYPPAYGPPGYGPPVYYRPQPTWGTRLALDVRVDGATGFGTNPQHQAYGLGGAGLGLRYRVDPHFAFELGADLLDGRDYNGDKRLELVGTLGGLVYLNPRSRAQLYLSGGLLADHATASAPQAYTELGAAPDQHYNHVGGYGGVGLEVFVTRRIAFHLDARGIVRQNVGGDSPEFTDPSTGRTTNTSAGLVGSAGILFYF
jgi:hypothetical protein